MLAVLPISSHGWCAEPWARHTIDNSSRGADGIRPRDVNGDGLIDLVTGWEEGGLVRVYLHPGADKCKLAWPAVTVGKVRSPEDAVFVDLDQDGQYDVVSCCEGKTRTVYVHWAPSRATDYLDSGKWVTAEITCLAGKQQWMFALPMQLDGQHGSDLVLGSKGNGATVGWCQAPADPRDLDAWRYFPLYQAGWIMSLVEDDLDQDGDPDILLTDRKGRQRGVWWLENPGVAGNRSRASWPQHSLGLTNQEVMFLGTGDVNGDRRTDLFCPTRDKRGWLMLREPDTSPRYQLREIENPASSPWGKAAAIGDLNGDGKPEIVQSFNTNGNRQARGVVWRQQDSTGHWDSNDISGVPGVKFDLVELIDVDADGDLDVVTCEERDNLGVIWYENPHR